MKKNNNLFKDIFQMAAVSLMMVAMFYAFVGLIILVD